MRQDNHGTALSEALQSATEPLTASELREMVGCSRQRVYTWLQANEAHLTTVGKDSQGGQRYVWADNRSDTRGPRAVTIERTDSDGDGMTMRVSTVMVDHGEVVLVLIGPDGSVYHARPAL